MFCRKIPKDHVKTLSDEPLLCDAEFSKNFALIFGGALTFR